MSISARSGDGPLDLSRRVVGLMVDSNAPGKRSRAYEMMLEHAGLCLAGRSTSEMALMSGVTFDEKSSAFRFNSLGQDIAVDYPSCDAWFYNTQQSPRWAWHLIMLHYLDLADGVPLGPQPITFRMMRGGFVRGDNFDRDSARKIAGVLGQVPEEDVKAACRALGAEFVSSNADVCAVFPFFPRFPITMKVWAADDELAGSGQMLVNQHADHYLTVEDAVVAGEMILDLLFALLDKGGSA